MSDYSGNGSGSDTDSHVGSVGSGTQVESGTGNTSSLNETQGNDLPLPKVLAQFAKGTINPRKPLLSTGTRPPQKNPSTLRSRVPGTFKHLGNVSNLMGTSMGTWGRLCRPQSVPGSNGGRIGYRTHVPKKFGDGFAI
jgi:hypothetical protein